MDKEQTGLSYIRVPSYIVERPNTAAAEEISVGHKAKDLMYLKFELMHANTNRNKDQFTPEELQTNFKTAIAKPINWEHTNEIIGHIYESEFIPFDGTTASEVDIKTDKVVCHGVIYKYRFPARASEIVARHDKSNLFFSMETYFDKVQCSQCEEIFAPSGVYCDHLKNRYQSGAIAARKLLGINICGAGCVKSPADDARGLSIASRNNQIDIVDLMSVLGAKFTIADYINFVDLLRIKE